MTKYGLPILLAGGGLYLFSQYSHIDYDEKGKPVLIPREKFKGTISFNEALVDDNGNPIIDPDTGKVVYAPVSEEGEEEEEIVPTTVARNIEDIFNYDSSSQELFKNSIINNMTITADTPEWEREYILAHLELSSEMTDRIEAEVKSTISGQTNADWFTAGSSIYQAFNDLFEASYSNSYEGNRTKELAYNHEAIDLTAQEFMHVPNNTRGNQMRHDKIAGIIGTDWDDWAPLNGRNIHNYRSNGALFEQHRGYLEDGTARFGTVTSAPYHQDGSSRELRRHYNTLDGVKIDSSDFTNIRGFGDVRTSNLTAVLAGLG